MKSSSVTSDGAFLSTATLFSPLPVPVLEKIFTAGEVRRYSNGDVVFRAGEMTEEMYVVKSGVIEICRVDPDTGADKVVAYIGEGDAIGEMVLFTGSPRSSMARVPEEAEVFVITRAGVIELCRQEPDLALYFARVFASRLESWVKKGRRQDIQRQLAGNLKFFDLATVMQTLGDSQSSGTLVIRSDAGRVHAELDFVDGKLVRAQLGHLSAEQACYQLFQPPPEGTFLFQGGLHLDEEAGPRINANVMGVLMEAMRLQDEWMNVRDRFAEKDRVFTPSPGELSWEEDDTLMPAFNIWSALHKGLSLGTLLAETPYCEAVVLTVLDRLLESKQVA